MRLRFCHAVLATISLAAGSASLAGPHVHLDSGRKLVPEEGRYACRHQVEVPRGICECICVGASTVFAPEITDIVNAISSADFAGIVADLSGENPVLVSGSPVTFTTRHSLSAQAELSWQYAFEAIDVLSGLGWQVTYHAYTQSGNALKNVVATLPGTLTPDQIYVIGGHIDSTSESPATLAPGAEDNATGSAAVILAAAALAAFEFESTIELVLFSGEEQGLWGSKAYVADAQAAGRDIRSAVTFDMIGYHSTDYGVWIEGEVSWLPLMNLMLDAVLAYTSLSYECHCCSFGSDHVPFQDAGIPAILAIDRDWDEYPDYHESTDVLANVDPDFGVQIARAGVAAIAHLAAVTGPRAVSVEPAHPPLAVALSARPNPTRGPLRIDVDTSLASHVDVYDLGGRLVRRLGVPPAGARGIDWDLTDETGSRIPAGVYWIRAGQEHARLVALR